MATSKRPKKICSAFGEKTFFAMAIDPAADKIPILIYSAKMTDSAISLLSGIAAMAERFSTPNERVDRATRHRAASPDHASCERRLPPLRSNDLLFAPDRLERMSTSDPFQIVAHDRARRFAASHSLESESLECRGHAGENVARTAWSGCVHRIRFQRRRLGALGRFQSCGDQL